MTKILFQYYYRFFTHSYLNFQFNFLINLIIFRLYDFQSKIMDQLINLANLLKNLNRQEIINH